MLWAGYISDSRELIGDEARRPGPAETREARASRGANDSIVAAWAGELGGLQSLSKLSVQTESTKASGKLRRAHGAWRTDIYFQACPAGVPMDEHIIFAMVSELHMYCNLGPHRLYR